MKLDEKFKTTEQKDFVDNYYNACSPTVQVCDLDKTHVMHIVPQKLWSLEILLDKRWTEWTRWRKTCSKTHGDWCSHSTIKKKLKRVKGNVWCLCPTKAFLKKKVNIYILIHFYQIPYLHNIKLWKILVKLNGLHSWIFFFLVFYQ